MKKTFILVFMLGCRMALPGQESPQAIEKQAEQIRAAAGRVAGQHLEDCSQRYKWSDESPVHVYDYGYPLWYGRPHQRRTRRPAGGYNPGRTSIQGWGPRTHIGRGR